MKEHKIETCLEEKVAALRQDKNIRSSVPFPKKKKQESIEQTRPKRRFMIAVKETHPSSNS